MATIIEQIRAEIKRLEGIDYPCDTSEQATGFYDALDRISRFLDTLQKPAKRTYKDCMSCEHCIPRKDQIGWQFYGCFGGDYKGKYIAEIDVCPLKVAALQEQSCDTCTNDKGCVTCKDGELWEGKEVDLEEAASSFAWKKEQPLADGERLSYTFKPRIEAFKAGAEWQKEQMLKDAVEGTVIESFNPVSSRPEHGITLIYEDEGKPYWLPGDHFKFIPIKED